MDPEETQERYCVVAYVCDITHIADIREAASPKWPSRGCARFALARNYSIYPCT